VKILVLNPPAHEGRPYIREGRCMQIGSSWATLWMPLTLAYVAAVLREDGHDVRLADAVADRLDLSGVLALRDEFKPDLVFLNTAFPSIEGDRAAAAALKRRAPGVPIVLLGLFPTLLEDKALDYIAGADFGLIGEPEWAARELAAALAEGGDRTGVKGLAWRRGGQIVVNAPQDLRSHDLDALPFPARDLLHNDAYRLPINGERFTLLNIGRGCPYPCIFCIAPVYYGAPFRKRIVSRIGDEIQECVERHGLRHFLFWGESFTTDAAYAEAICEEIIRRGFRVVWSTTSRVDTLTPRLLGKMKQAGCALLGLGIESADETILAHSGKKTRREDITGAIRMVHDAGIKTMGHFIFGLPGETRETAGETIRFALRSGLTYAQFYCALPYPKTRLGELAAERGWITSGDYSSYDFTFSILRNESLTAREVKAFRDRAYRRFYFRPRMLFRVLREVQSVRGLLASMDFLKWIRKK